MATASFSYRRALSPITLTASSLVLLVLFAYAPRTFADPDPAVIQDPPHSSSADAAAAAAAAAASSSSSSSGTGSGSGVPPPVVDPPPPIVPGGGIGKGLGFEFSKHLGFNAGAGAGLGSLLGLLPGAGGFAAPPIGGEIPPVDGSSYLGVPWFLGPQYIPQSWFGSALAAKGDLLFPIAIFIFAVIGVILTVKFLLALLVPFLAKKWAIAEALTGIKGGRLRRSAEDSDHSDVPQDSSRAHQAHIDELTGKVVPATQQLPQGIHQGQRFQGRRFAEPDHAPGQDSDNGDSDSDFDG